MDVTLSPDLTGRVKAAFVCCTGVRVAPGGAALVSEFESLASELRAAHEGCTPAEIEGLRPARELYRAFGIDPTKTRPSSESLLRRALKSKPLPQINNAVDVCNLLSLRFLLPLGLYDAARIQGAVEIRTGQAGETYAGIRKADVHVEGRLVLADEVGPFGNPTSDSARTSVGETARELLLAIFAPGGFDGQTLRDHAAVAAHAYQTHVQEPGAPAPDTWLMNAAGPQ